jgi:hypothetical protein
MEDKEEVEHRISWSALRVNPVKKLGIGNGLMHARSGLRRLQGAVFHELHYKLSRNPETSVINSEVFG